MIKAFYHLLFARRAYILQNHQRLKFSYGFKKENKSTPALVSEQMM